MTPLELAREALALAEALPVQCRISRTVFQCSFCKEGEPDAACGMNGYSFDFNREECGHPLCLGEAKLWAHASNNYAAIAAEVIRLTEENERMRERIANEVSI
jgi:hypothetical protein